MSGKGARQSNSTITNLRVGFVWWPGIVGAGWACRFRARFVLLHPLRRPRQAGRFDVSSIASNGAIFKFRALTYECYRSVSSCASLHFRRHGDLDRDFWRAHDAWHADRYFSEYQHPGHLRNMELYRLAAGRYGKPRRRDLRTVAVDERQCNRANSVSV